MAENLEQVTAQLPVEQVRFLKSKAALHGTSMGFELRKAVHLRVPAENLLAADFIGYATAAPWKAS